MTKERIFWIDYAKAAAIFCVVLLHTGITDPYRKIIYTSVIPLFFFLSGIFSKPTNYRNIFDFIKYKGSRILIPYFFFNFITYLFWVFIGRHYGLDSDKEISATAPIAGIIFGTSKLMVHYIPLWFLASLFSVETIHYLIFKHINSIKAKVIILISFILIGFLNYKHNNYSLPWGIDIALTMIVFYEVGNLASKEVLEKRIPINFFLIFAIFSSIIVFFIFKLNEEVNVHSNYYGNYLYFFLGAFSGITFTVSVFKVLELVTKPLKIMLFIGKNTLIILSLHLISISFLKAFMVYILRMNYTLYEDTLIYSIILSAFSIILLIPAIFFINRYFPLIVGKTIRKNTDK